MNECKISVVMSTYNESIPVLKEAIDSILNQTYRDFEFIIVLDNPDNIDIKNTVEAYSGQDVRIRIIYHSENKGLVQSLNDGIRAANGELIARMDADDIADPVMLEEGKRNIDALNLDMFSASKLNFTDDGEIVGSYSSELNTEKLKKLIPYGNPVNHPSTIIKKEVIQSFGCYRKIEACEDYDLWMRMILSGCKMQVTSQILIKCRIRKNSVTRTDNYRQYLSERFIKEEIKTYRKGKRFLTEQDFINYKNKSKGIDKEKFNKAYAIYYSGLEKLQKHRILAAVGCFAKALFSDARILSILKNKLVYGLIKRYG